MAAHEPRELCARCLFATLLEDGGGDESAAVVSSGGLGSLPRTFGSYELLEELARGGMGVVYCARQASAERLVAVKVLAAGTWASPDFVTRFRTEAVAVASLDHPNIVPIYEAGECEGQPFFSMKFIEGGTLAGRRGKVISGSVISNQSVVGGSSGSGVKSLNTDSLMTDYTPQHAARLVATLARAVHYAHQRGVLHRDIKPGNVLLDAAGTPYLTDFGLAKLVKQDSSLTHSTAMLGTPSYMSPEQARGEAKQLTTAVDVYGLGAVFYELLTGRPPFVGATTVETVRRVLEEEPVPPSKCAGRISKEAPERLSTAASTLSPDLETICLKCLEKDPARRYGSAEALALDLERWLRHEPILARPTPPVELFTKWVQRHRAMAAALVIVTVTLLAGTAVSLWQAVRATRAEQAAREKAEAETAARKTAEATSIFLMNVFGSNSPGRDGKTITVAEKLAVAVVQVDSLNTFPEHQRELLLILGRSYLGLGLPREATPLFTRYRDACRAAFGPDDRRTHTGESLLATALDRSGWGSDARALWQALLARQQKHFGPSDASVLNTASDLAASYLRDGAAGEAIPLLEMVLRLRSQSHGPDDSVAQKTRGELAGACAAAGQRDKEISLREDWLARRNTAGSTNATEVVQMMHRLSLALIEARRIPEALRHAAAAAELNPKDWALDFHFATLHSWFGSNTVTEAMSARLLAREARTRDAYMACAVVRIASLQTLPDPDVRMDVLELARRSVELGRNNAVSLPWFQLGHGMAAYRQGEFAEAEAALQEALLGARNLGVRFRPRDWEMLESTVAFYRGMSLLRQGHKAEAAAVIANGEAKMKPLPADTNHPLADRADYNDLLSWLACKEAKALLHGTSADAAR